MKHSQIAPAKLNLWLKVLGKRIDGFHDIESLIVPISGLNDVLRFDVREGNAGLNMSCNVSELSIGEDNLIIKAVALIEKELNIKIEGYIKLEKNIPIGAGLGGGSADAAATLSSLNCIFKSSLSLGKLGSMAAELGSDVPFFVNSKPSLCRGKGYEITPYSGVLTNKPIVLIKPPFEVSSAWAYSNWVKGDQLYEGLCDAQRADWGEVINDLEAPVFKKFLVLPAIKSWLLESDGTELALMSGSGSTMFAVCVDLLAAQKIVKRAQEYFGSSLWTKIVEIKGV
ncbi:MAG: 4-(cytidine 5'-diphospho)-2-C-methyl-D-erythritol kinase [Verrucomicrobiales bacterium]|nr:4-(cytidine 5'-diphospho)-2-C-methyl-D-erythritol kinase [Verrucomicrobiales bacterium]